MILAYLKQYDGDEIHALIGLTLNNLSCSYKRDGRIEDAQKCLHKALELQEKLNYKDDLHEVLNDQTSHSVKFEKSPGRNTTFGRSDNQEE